MDKVGGVQGPKSPGCRRCLFGKVNSRVRQRVQEELTAIRHQDQQRWNFDFEKEEPLEGRYAWSPVGRSGSPPPGGADVGDGSDGTAATCSGSSRVVSHSQGGSSIGQNPCPGGCGNTGHVGYWSNTGGAMQDTCGHIEDSPPMEEFQISDPTTLEESTGGFSPAGGSSSRSSIGSSGGDELLQAAGFYPVPPDPRMMPSITQEAVSSSVSVLKEGGGSPMDADSAVLVSVPCHRPSPQSQPTATPLSHHPNQPHLLQHHHPSRHRHLPVRHYLYDDHAGDIIPDHQPPGGHQEGIKHTGARLTPTTHTLSTESSSSDPACMTQHSPPATLGHPPGGEGSGDSSTNPLVSPHHVVPSPPGDAAAAVVAEATKRRQTQVTEFYTQQKMTRLQKPKDDAL